MFSRILVERVEPQLGIGRPTILYEYPSAEAALARRKAADPRVAERFELYACGVELANGFGELTDRGRAAPPLRGRRWPRRSGVYGERYPIDEDFLAALAIMPPASGIALGFDRLVMLATGAPRIEQVLWTPVAESVSEAAMSGRDTEPGSHASSQNTLRRTADLVDAGLVPEPRLPELERVAARYAVAITPAMAGLIDPDDPRDPIARQFVPDLRPSWSVRPEERADPIGDDAHSPVEGDRASLSGPRAVQARRMSARSTAGSAFAARHVGPRGKPTLSRARTRQRAWPTSRDRPQIWEVILTGGDPLVLSDRRLADVMTRLAAIEHVKIVRIHTRHAGGRAGTDHGGSGPQRSRPTARRPTWCCMPIIRAN